MWRSAIDGWHNALHLNLQVGRSHSKCLEVLASVCSGGQVDLGGAVFEANQSVTIAVEGQMFKLIHVFFGGSQR